MKWLVSLLCLAGAACAQPTNAIREAWLDPLRVVRIPVARDRLTTVRFPSPIADLEGAYLSADPDPPARFQISFHPGSAFFALRALVTNASSTLTIGWKGNSYVLELVESPDPALAVFLSPKPLPPEPEVLRSVTPARLRAILQTAKLFACLQAQEPALLADVERLTPKRRAEFLDCELVLDEVFCFNADDTLVFHITFQNRTVSPLAYLPEKLAVKVGERVFLQSAVEAEGVVPPCGQASAWFAISAAIKGTPRGVSAENDFQILFERLGPVLAMRCDATRPINRKPARSPKDDRPLR